MGMAEYEEYFDGGPEPPGIMSGKNPSEMSDEELRKAKARDGLGESPDMVCVETMLDVLVAAILLSRTYLSTIPTVQNGEDALVYARQLRFKAEEMERYARENKKA